MTALLDDWISHLGDRGKSEHTIRAYRRAVEHFIEWNNTTYGTDSFDPSEVIIRDVRDWISHQKTVEKSAVSTVSQRVTGLSRFFEWAKAEGIADDNPADAVSVSRPAGYRPQALKGTALRKLLRAVHSRGKLRDIAIIETLAGTGVRVSELVSMELDDLTIRPRSGKLVVRESKHGGTREVPLTIDVRRPLREYLEQVHPERKTIRACFERKQYTLVPAGEPVWHGQRGPIETTSAIYRIVNKYGYQAGFPDSLGPHVLRHTFAVNYLEENPGDFRGLAAILGHEDLQTVMAYTEPRFEDLAARMEGVTK